MNIGAGDEISAPFHILVLGGTAEAAELGKKLAEYPGRFRVTVSTAGRTTTAIHERGRRIGSFGGPSGLLSYLQEAAIDGVIDATHPFATRISAHADEACRAASVPLLRFERPAWRRQQGDRWIQVVDAWEAASMLPEMGRRIWLTTGLSTLQAFASADVCDFVIRLIAVPPQMPLFRNAIVIYGRGPFNLAGERRIISDHRIEVLVSKASGGRSTEPKLIAAREAGIPVVMIRRPQALAEEGTPNIGTVETALDWVRHLCARTRSDL